MGWSEPKSIGLLAWITVFAGALSLPFLLFLVPDSELTRVKVSNTIKTPFLSSVKSLIKNKLFMRLLSAWLLNGIANGIPAVLFFLYLDKVLIKMLLFSHLDLTKCLVFFSLIKKLVFHFYVSLK